MRRVKHGMPQHGVRARHLPWSVEPSGELRTVDDGSLDDGSLDDGSLDDGSLDDDRYLDDDEADGFPDGDEPDGTPLDGATVALEYPVDADDLPEGLPPLPRAGRPTGPPFTGAAPWYRGRRRITWPARGRRPAVAAAVAAAAVAAGFLIFVVALPAPAGRPTTVPAAAGGASPATSRSANAAGPAGPTGFAPLSIEAESGTNTLTGSAQLTGYPGASGGRVVRLIGNWGGATGAGGLRFNDVVVPATGRYVLTFYYVNINMNEPTRSVLITASGQASFSVTVAGGGVCCSAQVVTVDLVQGLNTITFSNPHGHAPTIDRITVDMR